MAMRTVPMLLKDRNVTVAIIMPGLVKTRLMHQASGMSLEEASQQTNFDFDPTGAITPVESASRIIKVTASLNCSDTGIFLNHDGSPIA
jgi:NAD(P)-dependent dehydrogenase (short-subunit alcohol dehydrogenase family)